MTIFFICAGNTCRSPLAEIICRELAKERGVDVDCQSRGLVATDGDPASQGARMIAAAHFYDLTGHKAQALNEADLVRADEVYTMTRRHHSLLCEQYPYMANRIKMLSETDIDDPWGADLSVYEDVFQSLRRAVENLPVFKVEK